MRILIQDCATVPLLIEAMLASAYQRYGLPIIKTGAVVGARRIKTWEDLQLLI